MSSINHLELALLDLKERISRERQFSQDALNLAVSKIDILIEHHNQAIALLRDHRSELEKAGVERDQMLAILVGHNSNATDPRVKEKTNA